MKRRDAVAAMAVCLVTAAALGAEPEQVQAEAKRTEEPRTAIHLRVGLAGTTPVLGVGIGVLGGVPAVSSGLSGERFVSRTIALTLGLGGGYSRSGGNDLGSVTLEPGVRWYPAGTHFDGGWVGASVPLSYASSLGVGAMWSLGGSVTLSAGWSLRLGEHFVAELSAGPVASVRMYSAGTFGTVMTSSIGLQGAVSIGVTL